MIGIVLLFLLTPEAPFEAPYLSASGTSISNSSSLAETPGTHPRYKDCIKLISEDLEIGRIAAQQWTDEGGGSLALHCLAIADIAAGFPRLGATRLASISDRPDAGDNNARARVLGEAALAWLDGDQPDLAEEAIKSGLKLSPNLAELQIVAAKVYSAAEKWQLASNAVTIAEKANLITTEAYTIRARANLILGRDFAAADDVVAALSLDPFNLDALVLRGELRQAGIEIETFYTDDTQ